MPNRLYRAGQQHARDLIRRGLINHTASWSWTAEDQDGLLGDPPDWDRFACWRLGIDADQDRETQAASKYPFGKDGQVYRSALIAIRRRAGQQGDDLIFDAAGELLALIDEDEKTKAALKPWYEIRAQGEPPEAAEIYIYGDIGGWDGVIASEFIRELKALGDVKRIAVRIDSKGGDVFDAINVYNALTRHPADIFIYIDAVAASAASVIAMAGHVVMPRNTMMMIHEPWGGAVGTAGEMRKMAEALDRVRDAIASVYADKTGLPLDEIRQFMADETEQDVVELYSVSSTTIKDPSGEWELPPGWPDDNAYPGLNVTGPDAGNSVDQARVHEVGYVNLRGATRRNNFHTPNLQPYVNASSYRPAKTYRRASLPAAFQQVFLDVDWDKIEAGVKSRHSNLTNL